MGGLCRGVVVCAEEGLLVRRRGGLCGGGAVGVQ